MTTAQSLPEGVRYITVVFRVPPPDSPDYHELSRVLFSRASMRRISWSVFGLLLGSL